MIPSGKRWDGDKREVVKNVRKWLEGAGRWLDARLDTIAMGPSFMMDNVVHGADFLQVIGFIITTIYNVMYFNCFLSSF